MSGCVAVFNAGSSSLKLAVYDLDHDETVICRARLEGIGVSPRLQVFDTGSRSVVDQAWPVDRLDHSTGTAEILKRARELIGDRPVVAIGHRVAHGGLSYASPVRVDNGVIAALRSLVPLAPLHQPHNLAAIETIAKAAPNVPQVACFDTAFHRRQPPLAQMLGLPRRFMDEGLRRYGFHGLSYEYVSGRFAELAPDLAGGRVIIAHLGNGASICGLEDRRSIATSMGFSALDGLLMGTRCGALDPGVLLYLMQAHGMDARALQDLLYNRSGLLGVSGVSADMRVLRASTQGTAAQAVRLFVYRAVREIGSTAAALSGIDALVFTGGIGENDADTRAEIAQGCSWLGVELDLQRNVSGRGRITADGSPIAAWVVPTDEERIIMRHTCTVLGLCHEVA